MEEYESEVEEEEEACSQVGSQAELTQRVSLTLTELRHILSALVKQHTEVKIYSSVLQNYTPLSHCLSYKSYISKLPVSSIRTYNSQLSLDEEKKLLFKS